LDLPSANSAESTPLARLYEGMSCRLTLLVAPAGSDPPGVLRRWVETCGHPAVCLGLSGADNAPGCLIRRLAAGFERLQPGVAGGFEGGGETLTPETINNALCDLTEDSVLLLLDYQHITAPEAHELVALLLDYTPPRLHLFISSTREPPLPLARLRVRRQMVQLDARWLGELGGGGAVEE
jgi:LuxR family maltose regulon positive regulatory protein